MKLGGDKYKNSTELPVNTQVQTDDEPKFKGSPKRKFFQYLDSLALNMGIIVVFVAIDTAVDWLFRNEVADSQSSAQNYSVEDIEGMILAGLILAFAINTVKLILEIAFDSYHYFFESEKDARWTSYKAFKSMTPFQQWLIVSILFAACVLAYPGILKAIV